MGVLGGSPKAYSLRFAALDIPGRNSGLGRRVLPAVLAFASRWPAVLIKPQIKPAKINLSLFGRLADGLGVFGAVGALDALGDMERAAVGVVDVVGD